MTPPGNDCGSVADLTGVRVTCHRVPDHKGSHHSPMYGVRWRDTGEVVTPPRSTKRKQQPTCATDGCSLWLDHAGPHGEEMTLL